MRVRLSPSAPSFCEDNAMRRLMSLIIGIFLASTCSVIAQVGLRFGSLDYGGTLNFGYRATDTMSVLTYGMDTGLAINKSTKLTGLIYLANPEALHKVSSELTKKPIIAPMTEKKGKLLVQNLATNIGKANITAAYIDVDQSFIGFQTMREQNKVASSVIDQLEKQKGTKKIALGIVSESVKISNDTVTDVGGSIRSTTVEVGGPKVLFKMATTDTGKGFTHFTDDAQKATSGTKRSSNSLSMQLSKKSRLVLSSSNIKSGSVTTVDEKGFVFSTTGLALTNTFKSVAGLDRTGYVLSFNKKGVVVDTSISSIGSETGQVERKAIAISTPTYNLYYNRHNIDAKFNKLGGLLPTEVTSYGNEYGMSRSEMGASTKLIGGNITYTKSDVTDNIKVAVLSRSSIDYVGKQLKIKMNTLSVPTTFTRVSYLSNAQADKDYLTSEYGFNRKDYWVNFQANSALNVDAYSYDASNNVSNQDKKQRKYTMVYTPRTGPSFTVFNDTYEYSSKAKGMIYNYDHTRLTFNHTVAQLKGMQIAASQDVMEVGAQSTTVNVLHVQQNITKYTKLAYDSTDIILRSGSYDRTKKYSIESPITRDLAVVGNLSTRDLEGEMNDEENFVLGLRYALNSKLLMTFASVVNSTKQRGLTRNTQITLSGLLAKRFGPLSDVVISSSLNSTEVKQQEVARTNITNVSANVFGGKLNIENSDIMNPQTGKYIPVSRIGYIITDPKNRYSVCYQSNEFQDSAGKLVKQDSASATVALSRTSSFSMNTYRGTNQLNTPNNAVVVLPISGNRYVYSSMLNMKQSLYGDYSVDQNELNGRRARTLGVGTKGELRTGLRYDFYTGVARLVESNQKTTEAIFRVGLDYKLNADHYVVFSAQRKSNIERSTITPDTGKLQMKVDYKLVFD